MKRIRSPFLRYGLAFGSFVLILLLSFGIQKLLPFRVDLTAVIIIAMIASAWYLGFGPGFMMALMLEGTLNYFSRPALTARAIVVIVNRMILFTSVVWFASSRRRAERKLREQSELLKVTISSIGDAVIATDVEGRVNFMNPVAEQVTGWTNAESSGQPLERVFQIFNEENLQSATSPFEKIKRTGTIVGLANHTVLMARDGKRIPIEDSAAPIKDADGRMIGAVIVFHDVTERRHAENEREQLLRRERLARIAAEEADRLKDEFLATVSHELRTPLTSIIGWASILKDGQSSPESLAKGLDVIERCAKAQSEIVGDILDVSSIITGKLRTDRRTVAIGPIVSAAIDAQRIAADARKINLSFSQPIDPVMVAGDPDRLQQVFWNLISNAIKFTPEGGRVDIELTTLAGQVELRVVDSGIGIADDFIPHLFERFRQGDSSSTRAYRGLGLGLSIVRHLVELHGGEVTADSAGPGQGATFIVRLPAADSTLPVPVSEPAPNGDSVHEQRLARVNIAGVKILAVDDEIDTLEILSLMLARGGAEVRTATSAAEGLGTLKNWKPDVLLCDLSMPGEDGFTFISRVRSLTPEEGAAIPAAAITAHVREHDRAAALAAGYQAHLPKPVDEGALHFTVATLVGEVAETVSAK